MTRHWHRLRRAIRGLLARWPGRPAQPPAVAQAWDLIDAIDRGGLPLNPMRVNQIARNLGLDVSPHARMDDTIERIRAALRRAG